MKLATTTGITRITITTKTTATTTSTCTHKPMVLILPPILLPSMPHIPTTRMKNSREQYSGTAGGISRSFRRSGQEQAEKFGTWGID